MTTWWDSLDLLFWASEVSLIWMNSDVAVYGNNRDKNQHVRGSSAATSHWMEQACGRISLVSSTSFRIENVATIKNADDPSHRCLVLGSQRRLCHGADD